MPKIEWLKHCNSIQAKFTFASFVTITLLITFISFTLFVNFRTLLRERVLSQQFGLVSEIADQMNGRVQLAQHQLMHMAEALSRSGLKSPDKELKAISSGENDKIIFDAGFLLISKNGRIIATSMSIPNILGMNIGFREYVSSALRTRKPYISAPFITNTHQRIPMIAIVVPVNNSKGELVALLAGYHTLGTGHFLTSLASERFGSSGYLYILHGRTLLMHPDRTRVLEVVPEGKNIGIDKSVKGFEGSTELYTSQGRHMLTSFKRIGETGWVLASNTPYEEIAGPFNKLAVNTALISVVGIFASMLATWYISRRLTKAVQKLTDNVDSVYRSGGEWEKVELHTGDEIERLAAAFNTLMEEVVDANRALDQGTHVYNVIAEFTSEIAYWRNPDMSLRFISANCLKLTGYMDAEFYAEPELLDRLIHPDDQRLWQRICEEAGMEQQNQSATMRLIGKDNKLLWVSHTSHKVYDENQQLSGVRGSFSDITNVMLINKKLEEEKLFIENLINSSAIPLFVIDSFHRVIFWNKALETITGVSSKDVQYTDLQWSAFYPEKRKTLADITIDGDFSELCMHYSTPVSEKPEKGLRVEGWFSLKGNNRYLILESSPIIDRNGQTIAAVETITDITERIVLQEKLRQLTRAVEQSPATIVITDINGNIEYVNPKFCKTTGYNFEEALGKNPNILKSGEQESSLYKEMWDTINSGKEWRGEFHNRRKDGSLFWEFASISPLLDRDNRINGFLAVKEDITERKAIEAELAASRKDLAEKHRQMQDMFQLVEQAKLEWEQTLDQLQDIVVLTDAQNRIRRSNRLLSDISGLTMGQLMGSDWHDIMQQAGFSFKYFSGQSGELIHSVSGKTYDLTVYERHNGKHISGYVISLNDTTELRATTRELEKAYEELKTAQMQVFQQEKMASIGQLAAGVAHEINNPMGFISSNLSTLNKYFERMSEYFSSAESALSVCTEKESTIQLEETKRRLKINYIMDDARHLIAESLDGAGRVRRIVQDLKSFSRVDQPESAFIDVNAALETTINIAWNEIKYVAVLNRKFSDIPQIKCFPQQLNQVFLNILINAAHAITEKNGIIDVQTWADDTNVYVSVSDNGCGIPEKIMQKIFEPFFTTKEVGKGTGLGLSISYDIVKKHGGNIIVESEIGRGTTFTVTLPVEHPKTQDVEAANVYQ